MRIHDVPTSVLPFAPASAPMTPEMLCALYADKVCRFAVVVAGRDRDPEDIAQDALLKAITRLDRFDPARGSMEGWLWRIVANTAKDAMRRAHLRALLTERVGRSEPAMVNLEDVAVERRIRAAGDRARSRPIEISR